MQCAANISNASPVEQEILKRFSSGQYELRGQMLWNNETQKFQSGCDGKGYHVFSYWDRHAKKTKVAKAHRIIWLLKVGDIPGGMQINHIDGVKTNNDIQNLELVTCQENAIHALKLGLWTPPQGENSGFAKMFDRDVIALRQKYRDKHDGCMPLSEIKMDAARFGVSVRVLSYALAGKYYKNLPHALGVNHPSACSICRAERHAEEWKTRKLNLSLRRDEAMQELNRAKQEALT